MTNAAMTDTSIALPCVDLSRRYVRVRGQQDSGFIDFDFSVGWPELVVELLLLPEDFAAFCRDNKVQILPPMPREDEHASPAAPAS